MKYYHKEASYDLSYLAKYQPAVKHAIINILVDNIKDKNHNSANINK